MPIVVPNDRVWIDGIILYRDDIERLARLICERLPEDLRVASVKYKDHQGPIVKISLGDVDLKSVEILDIAHGRAVIDVTKGRLSFRLPHEHQDQKVIGDFFKTLERIKPPSRIKYLISKPNPYRLDLVNLTRAEAGRQKRDLTKPILFWSAIIGTIAAVVALFR